MGFIGKDLLGESAASFDVEDGEILVKDVGL